MLSTIWQYICSCNFVAGDNNPETFTAKTNIVDPEIYTKRQVGDSISIIVTKTTLIIVYLHVHTLFDMSLVVFGQFVLLVLLKLL